MSEVTITLNGRTYRLECDDGEEEHLLGLSELVGKRLDGLQKQFGQVGDERLLLMTALTIADELSDTQDKLAKLESQQSSVDELVQSTEARVAEEIEAAADRIEVLSSALGNDPTPAKGD